MTRLSFNLVPGKSASDLYWKLHRKMRLHTFLEAVKLAFIGIIATFLLLEYFSPNAQTSAITDWQDKKVAWLSMGNENVDLTAKEVTSLAQMIRLVTDDQVSENKALRYAGLIYHASQRLELNPLEIVALIMAESSFKVNSVNIKSGDYGLGQINWEHWGKPLGLTPHDLMDPSINIFLTCHVYKYFGEDFGKYHRGYGIKSKAYVINVKSILSTLIAFAKSKKMDMS